MLLGVIGSVSENPRKETVTILQAILESYTHIRRPLWSGAMPFVPSCVDFLTVLYLPLCRVGYQPHWQMPFGLGCSFIQLVDRKFEAVKYYTDFTSDSPGVRLADLVSQDAKYAVRKDSPAFYENPTPESCKVGPQNSGYIVWFFLSHFAPETISRCLRRSRPGTWSPW